MTNDPAHPLFVPDFIQRSRLKGLGGFLIAREMMAVGLQQELAAEARRLEAVQHRSALSKADGVDVRGGSPPHCLGSVRGGTTLIELYFSGALRRKIGAATGLDVKPTGANGVYIYYSQGGDFIGLHRDMVTCDLTVITCLQDSAGDDCLGGQTRLYPDCLQENLSSIELSDTARNVLLRIEPGHTLLILGGLIPHEIVPVQPGQVRTISLLCFQAIGGFDGG